MEILRLGPLLARRPSQLPGGEKQRVAIGRALVREPRLFMLDEPLSNLDAGLRADMRSEIKLLQQRLGTTTLFVTHDPAEAMTIATLIGVMRHGAILQTGAPMAVYDRPENTFVAGFLGAPGMSLIAGRLVCGGAGFGVEVGEVTLPTPTYAWRQPPEHGRPVLLGLRLEDVGPAPTAEAFTVQATPILLQPTGADTLARFRFGEGEITGRLSRDHRAVLGQPMPLGLRLSRGSIFCAASGCRP